MSEQNTEVVVDEGKSSWSDLWKTEDYWAIWLGFALLIIGAIIYLPRTPRKHGRKIREGQCSDAGRG